MTGKEWIYLGDPDLLRNAQRRLGLTNGQVGRRLHVSPKTWQRNKNLGRVPTAERRGYEEALGIAIPMPQPPPSPQRNNGHLQALEEAVAELADRQTRILGKLDVLDDVRAQLLRIERALEPPASETRR